FIGVVDKPGMFTERCAMCGDCILHLTGGLCPIARCSKSLFHGPCGGSSHGKCEISKEVDCVWDMIVRKKMEQGRLEDLMKIRPDKNWKTSRDGGPRKQVREDLLEETG
ncbi:MAG: methylenetetrahydrofolate reductase C-terminal domain-containing protein, partial [Pseudomonadota bacterium]